MAGKLAAVLKRVGAPPRKFWEETLEVPARHLWSQAQSPGFSEAWLAGLSVPQREVLGRNLAQCGREKGIAEGDYEPLVPYFFLSEFVKHKSRAAILAQIGTVFPQNLPLLWDPKR